VLAVVTRTATLPHGGDADGRTLAGQPAEKAKQTNHTKRGTTMSSEQPPKKLASDVFSDAVNQILNDLEASLRASLPATAAEIAVVIMRLSSIVFVLPPLILFLFVETFGPIVRAIVEPFFLVVSAIFSAFFSSKPNNRD
jgi:hypothetical protein